ncbi:DinB family protein [Paenisporosarcina cavernae]|uniref:DinB family protein n=1 Tax=Paenisporosarcina cavernae TaxID=2320858 RepID=A0A385YVG8_9BACL|nr:DinB family protein [Paenisporosarcina cavernae]AYC30686.1 DinB family protein [Paenisporosarcina cavernae]
MAKEKVKKSHEDYQSWLESLKEMNEEKANSPYAEGKWSPKEIVMHLAEWDRYTAEERLPHMKEGAKLDRFPDFETYNKQSSEKAKSHSFAETVDYAKSQRQRLTEELDTFPESRWTEKFSIGDHFLSIEDYFMDFAEHDAHHKKQVDSIQENSSKE